MKAWSGLDRVVSLDAERGVALRNVTSTLQVLDHHFPRFPVMPGVLILGSMGELAGLVLEEATGRRWRLAGARQVRYRHFVQPGDQMEISVEVKELAEEAAVCKADVKVDGRAVTTARALRMVPA